MSGPPILDIVAILCWGLHNGSFLDGGLGVISPPSDLAIDPVNSLGVVGLVRQRSKVGFWAPLPNKYFP